MGGFAWFTKNPKATFACIFSYALLFCVWIFVQEQTPKRRLVAFDQQIDELFPNSPLFKLKEVTESDVRLWQRKFYSSLASATKPQSENPGGGVLPYMGYIGMCGPEGHGFSAV